MPFGSAYSAVKRVTWFEEELGMKDMNDLRSLDVLRLTFQPSQGVFHLVIFLWQKVDAVRRCNPDLEFSTTKILLVTQMN